MLNRRAAALALTAALGLSLGATAFAVETGKENDEPAIVQASLKEESKRLKEEAGPDTSAQKTEESGRTDGESAAPEEELPPEPDPEGTLSFANVEARVRENNLQYLILQESVARVEANDYEKMQEDLRDQLNGIAELQWMYEITGNPMTAQSLRAQYDAVREQFDDLRKGKLQKEAADGIRQLQAAQNSIVMLSEGMYIQLDALAAADLSMERALTALDRQIQELELRYQLGQISAMTLQQTKAGRTALVSQRQTLASSAQTLTMNLEAMVGGDLSGTLRTRALPQVSGEELAALDLETDLEAAKAASFDLYSAKKTLDNAEKDYKKAGTNYNYNEKKYQFVQAKHTWQGAQYTYDSAVQNFELKFRTLYTQIKDFEQVLAAAQTALAVERDNYAVAQLKHQQGTISQNALLTAEDKVSEAQDKVDSAQRDLFSACNNYRWAVEHGILN